MKKYVGLIKIHYINSKGEKVNGTISSHVYNLKEFQEAVSLYTFLKENEIECDFNTVSEEWNTMDTVFVDDVVVTLGNDVDLWVLDVYVK